MLESSAFYSRKSYAVSLHQGSLLSDYIERRRSVTPNSYERLREALSAGILEKGRFFRRVSSHRFLVVKSPIIRLDVSADGSSEIIPGDTDRNTVAM